jgi:aldehyde dehydrogenase (NAD+)
MGKPLALAQDEIARTAQTLRFYAVEGQTYSGETFPCDDPDMVVYTQREPLGVVAVIAPWNFPASIPARKIAPALITGNTVVFKPSSDAPLTGLRLAEALVAGGLPPGVLNFVTGRASAIGAALTGAPEVKAVTFTGSTAAGEQIHRSVAMTTRTQMELGGKNPLIVMEDADLDAAADLAVKGGLSLTGQACTGTSRVLVMQPVREAFLARLLARVQALRIGNGLEPGVDLGPLATAKQFETVLSYIEIGKTEGTLLCGGRALTGPAHEHGWFVEPAVFTDVSPQARIAQEEIFGPVLAVITVDSYQQAIAIANDTPYGLSAAIATRNPRYVHEFCRDIQSGTVKVNRTTTGNLTNAPFGGYKASTGSGFRESGRVGLEFFTQTKTVYRAV